MRGYQEPIGPMNIYGKKVFESAVLPEFEPVLQLRNVSIFTPAFVEKQNAWLLKMFGKRRYILVSEHGFHMHPNTHKLLNHEVFDHGGKNNR